MEDVAAAGAARSVRGSISAGVVIAVAGALLGAVALLGAALSVMAGDDRALWWMFAAIILPTVGYAVAWSRLMSAWSRSSDRVRHAVLAPSRPFALIRTLCGFWATLSPLVTLGALGWLVARLVDGASGWYGVAIPFLVASGLGAVGGAFTVGYRSAELGHSIPTFAVVARVTDGYVEKELARSPHLGGFPDWNSFWLHRIAYLTEHPPVDRTAGDCVDYVITARAAAGLPPLDGVERHRATGRRRSVIRVPRFRCPQARMSARFSV